MADQSNLVLIADGDDAVRHALQFALRLEGLCIHVHNDGASLLADPNLGHAGCVIVGDLMPRLDGFAVLSAIRVRDISVPAIMLTSHATPRMRAHARAAGVCAVVEKPLMGNALMEVLRSVLNTGT
jgi:FixJ family two-component response regulator